MKESVFVIRGRDAWNSHLTVYWSNSQGWVQARDATRFTLKERQTLQLPIGVDVKWLELVND